MWVNIRSASDSGAMSHSNVQSAGVSRTSRAWPPARSPKAHPARKLPGKAASVAR